MRNKPALILLFIFSLLTIHTNHAVAFCNGSLPQLQRFDEQRVTDFVSGLRRFSGRLNEQKRIAVIDQRIHRAGLHLADKIEVLKRLAPAADATGSRTELRIQRLLLAIEPNDLPLFKLALDYDGDYKDLVEYLFHDIDDEDHRAPVLEHFRPAQTVEPIGIKVLSDVDDTLYANLIDRRYPKKTLYPGVLEFYAALSVEPVALLATPVTVLSARPNPIAGVLENGSLNKLMGLTNAKLCASALSGALISSGIGTAQTFIRETLDALSDLVPNDHEDQIGMVKFENFLKFAMVYPDYRYVFLGDSGQADALAAQSMLASPITGNAVITTFIHDLRLSPDSSLSTSPSFRRLADSEIIQKNSGSGRGVIVYRNYIAAAVVAYQHAESLDHLISLSELATITRAALTQFAAIDFRGKQQAGRQLRQQYRKDGERAYQLLTATPSATPELMDNIMEIRRLLDE